MKVGLESYDDEIGNRDDEYWSRRTVTSPPPLCPLFFFSHLIRAFFGQVHFLMHFAIYRFLIIDLDLMSRFVKFLLFSFRLDC